MNTIKNPKLTMTCTVHGEVEIPHICKLKITRSGAGSNQEET